MGIKANQAEEEAANHTADDTCNDIAEAVPPVVFMILLEIQPARAPYKMDNKKDIIRYLLCFIRICLSIIINSRRKSKKLIRRG